MNHMKTVGIIISEYKILLQDMVALAILGLTLID